MSQPGIVYRPPYEANSLLLQVTTGCSHNQCSFCSMYAGVPFSVCPMEQVEADLDAAARRFPSVRRVFLENGDPFVLSSDRLLQIADAIHRRLPKVETIAMYASIQNIRSKSDNDLRRLREHGINELNIGAESGLDAALRQMNKGHTAEEAACQVLRLKAAGFDYALNIILGGAGPALRKENAKANAALLNATQPFLVFLGSLHAEPGCQLFQEIRSGACRESTFGELLDEEEALLGQLKLENTFLLSNHPSNVVPIQGLLPRDTEALLREIREARFELQDRLDQIPVRGSEGMILNGLISFQ